MKIYNKTNNLDISQNAYQVKKYIDSQNDKILCQHCFRTASNGIRCMGICVADNDY
tara:strand:- start:431 stop:598 length:168 start_codon:yes stop_codon:yes gene_type:complete